MHQKFYKILLILNLSQFFSLALAIVEFLAFFKMFTKIELQNISGNNASTWQQKLRGNFPSLVIQFHDLIPQFQLYDAI